MNNGNLTESNPKNPDSAGEPSGWERINELKKYVEDGNHPRHVVVIVHGTASAKPTDISDDPIWWQRDGILDSELSAKNLCSIAFHWSGANLESCRRAASIRLWLFLVQLESIRVSYSVVAHSHGGNVLVNALKYGLSRNDRAFIDNLVAKENLPVKGLGQCWIPHQNDNQIRSLPNLKQWMTVGTPYLSHSKSFDLRLATLTVIGVLCIALFAVLAVFAVWKIWPLWG